MRRFWVWLLVALTLASATAAPAQIVGGVPLPLLQGPSGCDPRATLELDYSTNLFCSNGQKAGSAAAAISGWSYSRTGTEYAQTSSGLLVPFGSGVPAITDLGLQVWEARTNLVLQSAFASGWGANNGTLTPAATTAPTGAATGATFLEAATASVQHPVASAAVSKASSSLAFAGSFYIKPINGRNFAEVQLTSASGGAFVFVNLLTGAVTNGAGTFGTNWSAASASATVYPSGWVRVVLMATNVTDTAVTLKAMPSIDGLTDNYTGDVTKGIALFGAQLEQAAFAGPYIPTTSASATRGAASASVGGLSLPSEFTLSLEGATSDPNGLFPVLAQIDGAADTNRVQVFAAPGAATTVGGLRVDSGGVVQANLSSANTAANGANLRLAASIKASRMALSMNGGAVSAGSGVVPSTTTLRIGNNFGAGAAWNGNIKRAVIYPYAMSDAQLQALTQ